MDSGPGCSGTSLVSMVQTSSGPVCDQVQSPSSSVRLSSPGPSSLGRGRSFHPVVRSVELCLPASPHSGKSLEKSKRGSGHDDCRGSLLASSGVVSGAATLIPCASDKASSGPKVPSSAKVRHSAQQSRRSKSSRLATVRDSLSSLGVSPDVIGLVQQAHRPGTQGVYNVHWNDWLSWCASNNVSPHSPSRFQLANYLASLSVGRKLSSSSVKVHRAAICTTIRQLGGPSFADDPLLRDLVKGAAIQEARNPRRVPAWDLFLVLSSLRRPPYEPIRESSLKYLSLKTAFLVALASGRRCSEVHALSGLPEDVAFEPDGSMSLRFLPDFLAKNQSPGSPSPSISIRPLSSILAPDDEDRTLCPVRALRVYRRRTKSFRQKQRHLFLSYNENHKEDIRRSSISRWLREVIKDAYARPGSELAVFSPRPHEIRAWASSLAIAHNVSLQSVLDAAYWRSPGTFIQFYLRDVSRLREDGVRGISSAVVAQHPISATRPASSHPSRQ